VDNFPQRFVLVVVLVLVLDLSRVFEDDGAIEHFSHGSSGWIGVKWQNRSETGRSPRSLHNADIAWQRKPLAHWGSLYILQHSTGTTPGCLFQPNLEPLWQSTLLT
jgi:hypothetical protein